MMSEPGICCGECFDIIAKRSLKAATLWISLCEIQTNSSIFGLRTKDFPALRILEILGFIRTTDTPDIIIIKVLGQQEDNDGVFFCGGHCEKNMQ